MPKQRYEHHDALHADGRHARPRHDVPHGDHPGEPRLRRRSRHGQEVARLAGAAADRDGDVRLLAVHRRQAQRLPVHAQRGLARHRQARAPACCRSSSRPAWATSATSTMRSTCRCISSTATAATSTSPAPRSATFSTASCRSCRASGRPLDDWSDHLTTLFPEVRLKRFLEMRGADGGRWRRICALPAFWVGLLYDQASLDAAWDLVKDWTRRGAPGAARRGAQDGAAHAVPQHHGARSWPARRWPSPRPACSGAPSPTPRAQDERIFLEPVEAILREGMTPADEILLRYERDWGRRTDPLFTRLRLLSWRRRRAICLLSADVAAGAPQAS